MPGVDVPDLLAGRGVDRHQPAVEQGDVDLPPVDRDAAVRHPAAAGVLDVGAVRLRVVGPDLLAGRGVEREDHAPAVRRVHHAVDDQRRALHPFGGAADRLRPGELQVRDVLAGDLVESGEALLLVGLAVGQPAPGLCLGGADDPLVVDVSGGGGGRGRIAVAAAAGGQQEKQEKGAGCPP